MASSKVNIFFRLDGSQDIGYGHFYRCVVLARSFDQEKYKITFLIRNIDPVFTALVRSTGYQVELAPSAKFLDLKSSDFATEMSQDIRWVANFSVGSLVILDHYAFQEEHQRQLKRDCRCLVVFDDLFDRGFAADVLINQNFGCKLPEKKPSSGTTILAGTEFALIRDAYFSAKKSRAHKAIVICFGATDPGNLTKAVLDTLISESIPLIAICGPGNSHYESLSLAYSGFSNLTILKNPDNIEVIFAQALCIVAAAGSLVWELAFLEKAIILYKVDANQSAVYDHLVELGLCVGLNESKSWPKTIMQLVSMSDKIEKMEKAISGIVDGNGKRRIVEAIERRLNESH